MKVDISDIITINGACLKIDWTGGPPEREPVEGCTIEGDVIFSGTLTNNSGILHLDGWLEAAYKSACYRCLGEVRGALRLRIKEDFSGSADSERNDMYLFEGKKLDISRALNDNIILNLPMKHLCSEQCRGLCSSCGANLNEVRCGCSGDSIDPRMEGLRSFFEKS